MVSGPKVKKPVCSKKHVTKFVPCATEVVYRISSQDLWVLQSDRFRSTCSELVQIVKIVRYGERAESEETCLQQETR
ncbi:MAG: hypothetical protein O7D30_01230, partial [Rickettsia endosymbiont of Ixodes persulcatus]|nr:hypothetical protein [Rickettsia endosymbiont of Ixodes persulcatus]